MVETIWDFNKSFLFSSVAVPAAQVVALVQKDKGVRIGQSSVISKNMHTFHPDTPEKINVLQGVDAGQAFYQRNEADTVYHIDVFHQCGKVDHHLVAANIKKAVDAYNLHYSVNRLSLNQLSRDAVDADYIDIQTSTGGGRITGSLIYGQKLSLRRAHENHVHIAAAFADEHVACLFYIALAVEDAILQSGLELRRNEQIIHINVSDKKVTNSSPYSDQSDSYIQDRKSGGTSVFLKRHQFTHDVVVLSDSFDTVQDVKEMMASIEEEDGAVKKIERKFNTNGNVEQMIKALAGIGIITVKNNKLKMTNYGREFKQYLDKNLINIQSQIRQMLKSLKPVWGGGGQCCQVKIPAGGSTNGNKQRLVVPFDKNNRWYEFAAGETVIEAAKRNITEGNKKFCFEHDDLRIYIRRQHSKAEVLFLIDASASMKGQRILAAKFLIRHLLLTTNDKIGVITFQNFQACIDVPFTRDYRQVETSLRKIKVDGATPLALGLKTGIGYLKTIKTNNPLIVLLTDGVPTLADISRDPVADALAYAQDIKRCGYDFMCIGLKSHRNYITKLAEVAGGRAYLLDELEKQVLVNAAWLERRGRCL